MTHCGRARRSNLAPSRALLALLFFLLALTPPALAWDSRTHQLIVRLAIAALPPGALKTIFTSNMAQLEVHAIEPDTVLRPARGLAEGRRHYIDLENFGSDPFAQLRPDFATMERIYGPAMFDRSGTLPWAIEDEAASMAAAWRDGDCDAMLHHAGYLAHYVGDASQPLHSIKFYDGYTAADRGSHARLESSVDFRVREFESLDRDRVHPETITSVWTPVIDELKQAHPLVNQTIEADRLVRETSPRGPAYTAALMAREQDMIASQLVSGASTLASIWLFVWRQSGSPSTCSAS